MINIIPESKSGFSLQKTKYGPYSISRLLVASCPQRFFGQYIRKDRSVYETSTAARGNAVHDVLAKITAHQVAKIPLKPHIVSQWASEAIGKYPASYDSIELIVEAADQYIKKNNPFLTPTTFTEETIAVSKYVEESFIDDAVPNVNYVEVPFRVGERPNPDVFFGGQIDLICIDHEIKVVTIIDYKTTPTSSVNPEHIFQLGSYAWLASLKYPGYRLQTSIYYAHPTLAFFSAPRLWSYEDLLRVENEINFRINAIESLEDFNPIPGRACHYCHMYQECKINQSFLQQNARGAIDMNVRSPEDLKRIAQAMGTVGALYDRLNNLLKEGLSMYSQDSVAVDGKWYGYKASDEAVDWIATDIKIRDESERARNALVNNMWISESERTVLERKANIPNLKTLLEMFGFDDAENFREWKAEKTKQIWTMSKPELIELLKEYKVTTKTTRFSSHKI